MCVHAWMAVFLKDSHLPKVACTCFKVHMCMGGSICVLCWIVRRCGNLHTCTCAFFLTVYLLYCLFTESIRQTYVKKSQDFDKAAIDM